MVYTLVRKTRFGSSSSKSPRELKAIRMKQIKVDDSLKNAIFAENKKKIICVL